MKGYLALQDGHIFEGDWIGDPQWVSTGEVVFNTSMVGYQEIITDPSYFQQIVVMTTPEQGNYGVSNYERESKNVWAEGFICLNLNDLSSEVRASLKRSSLKDELQQFKKAALTNVDTRSLTLHLRERGTPWGVLMSDQIFEKKIKNYGAFIEQRRREISKDWVYEVSVKETIIHKGQGKKGRVAVLDYGIKESILKQLLLRFTEVAVFNSRAKAEKIMDWDPHGVVLSNGPGDPQDVIGAVTEVKKLLGQRPIFGICMGHQILALALGGTTSKLKFGHRGSNHPVQNFETKEIYMTAQNHGYVVNSDLPTGVKVSQVNLYDKTVEGIVSEKNKAWSVQYHPEAGPGPHDSRVLFDYFEKSIL